jgi:hypothetical protein
LPAEAGPRQQQRAPGLLQAMLNLGQTKVAEKVQNAKNIKEFTPKEESV